MNHHRPAASGIFFLVVGPSGAGKDTLIDGARNVLMPGARHVFARRVITRAPDAGGEVHRAVSEEEFAAEAQAGQFLMTWSAHGLHYGLPANLSADLREGRHVIANGSRGSITELAGRVPRLVVLHVTADRSALADRIAERGREAGEQVDQRLRRTVQLEVPQGVQVIDIHNDGSITDGVEKLLTAINGAERALRVVRYPMDTWRERVAYLPRDSVVGADNYLGPGRISIEAGTRSITASVHVVETPGVLAPDELGLSAHAFESLALAEGTRVSIQRTPAPESRQALRDKIRGAELTQAQYALLLEDILQGRYPDSEVAAFLVAATRSLSDDEVIALARVRASFMPRIDWHEPIVVDKHSMGGIPGSRITLIVVPIVAAHGLLIPKTSSRAITSAAGTADAMATVARVDLTAADVHDTVRRAGGCIAWNGRLNHSALDDVMNHITRPLGIDSNRWSVASILSKKLSAGSTHVIVDLPWGPQAKLATLEEARELARLFELVGQALGLVVQAYPTDGFAPIGRGIGPALEVQDVRQVLSNDASAPADLREKALTFASRILAWDPTLGSEEAARVRAEALLSSGAALEKFEQIVDAQGRRADPAIPATLTHAVRAASAGRVARVDIARISEVARRAGAPEDQGAGIYLTVGLGDVVESGQVIYQIHASAATELEAASHLAGQDSGLFIGS